MANAKHYQTGADSCACGNLWPCTRMTGPGKKRARGKTRPSANTTKHDLRATTHVQSGKYNFVVMTREGGPPFDEWWAEVDTALAFMASLTRTREEREWMVNLNIWPYVEAGRSNYEAGEKPLHFAASIVRSEDDKRRPLESMFGPMTEEKLHHIFAQHYNRRNPELSTEHPWVCACGNTLPCWTKVRMRHVIKYFKGYLKHDHPTRELRKLGSGCAACDATHDLGRIKEGKDIEEVDNKAELQTDRVEELARRIRLWHDAVGGDSIGSLEGARAMAVYLVLGSKE